MAYIQPSAHQVGLAIAYGFFSNPRVKCSPFLHDKIPSKIVRNVFGRDVIFPISYSLETYI
jgi:hypothetical protein